jgi:hypothetical protein
MKALYVRLAAFAMYVVSFFLPAIQIGSSGPGTGPVDGWWCAFAASVIAPLALVRLFLFAQSVDFKDVLISFSGLVNWLFLAVCVLSFWPRFRRTRIVLGALMLPCFAATWIFLATSQTKPLAGHFVWIAACILVVIPDTVNAFHKNVGAAAIR